MSCHGGGCPFTRRTLVVRRSATCKAKRSGKGTPCKPGTTPTQNANLSALVRNHQLRAGDKLTITFTLRYFVGGHGMRPGVDRP